MNMIIIVYTIASASEYQKKHLNGWVAFAQCFSLSNIGNTWIGFSNVRNQLMFHKILGLVYHHIDYFSLISDRQ